MTQTVTPESAPRRSADRRARRSARRRADPGVRARPARRPSTLDGRSVCVIVPDGTRSCPLPLLLSAVHGALHGRVSRADRARRARHPRRDERAGAGRAPRLPGRRARGPLSRHDRAQPRVVGPGHASSTSGTIGAERIAELSDGMLRRRPSRCGINRAVVEHDVTLIVGPVFPHEVVGFSGGNKYLFPGVVRPGGHRLLALARRADHQRRDHRHPRHHPGPRADRRGRRRWSPASGSRSAWSCSPAPAALHAAAFGDPQAAWAAAADVVGARPTSATSTRRCAACCRSSRAKYEDMWTGAKGFYKVEPVVADGGQVVLYAPHIREVSRDAPGRSSEIGYHCRDYFLEAVGPLPGLPLGRPRALHPPARRRHLRRRSTASACGSPSPWPPASPRSMVRAINLDYLDPALVDPDAWAADPDTLVVPQAGEVLYRLR